MRLFELIKTRRVIPAKAGTHETLAAGVGPGFRRDDTWRVAHEARP